VNTEHFRKESSKLIDTFGKSAYSATRLDLIFRLVKDMPDAWLTKTIDKFCGECRQAPLIPEFREEVNLELRRQHDLRKSSVSVDNRPYRSNCFDCEGTGVLTAIQSINERGDNLGAYAYRCPCEAGHRDVRNWPVFTGDTQKLAQHSWLESRKVQRQMPKNFLNEIDK
jgi:hypothetical protein